MALRKGILGGVPTTTLAGSINNLVTSLTISDATGWTMAVPFVITVEPDTINEEQILVGTKVGTTFSNLTRGYANSGAKAHTASATCFVRHSLDPVLIDEVNQQASAATAVGDMLYYDGTKWVPVPHGTQGQILVEGASPTFVPGWAMDPNFALVNNAGEIPVGAADNTPQMLTPPASTGLTLVSNVAASLKMAWGQLPTTAYADASVTQAKIADGIINVNKLAGNYAPIFQQASEPAAPVRLGTLWANTANNITYQYNGTKFIPIRGLDAGQHVGCLAVNNPYSINANSAQFFMNWNSKPYDPFGMITLGRPEIVIPAGMGGMWAVTIYVANSGPSSNLVFSTSSNATDDVPNLGHNSVGAGKAISVGGNVYLTEGQFLAFIISNQGDLTNAAVFNMQVNMTRING